MCFPRFSGDFRTRFDLASLEEGSLQWQRRGSIRSSCVSARSLYRESDPKPVIAQLARQLNVHPEALRNWIRQDEADRGERHDRPTTEMLEENRRLERK